jgi:hypothetical protein
LDWSASGAPQLDNTTDPTTTAAKRRLPTSADFWQSES